MEDIYLAICTDQEKLKSLGYSERNNVKLKPAFNIITESEHIYEVIKNGYKVYKFHFSEEIVDANIVIKATERKK